MKKLVILLLVLNLINTYADDDLNKINTQLEQLKAEKVSQETVLSSCHQLNSKSCEDARAFIASAGKEISRLEKILGHAPSAPQNGGVAGSELEKIIANAIDKSELAFSGNSGEFSTLPGTTSFKVCQKVLKAIPYTSIKEIYSGKNPSSLSFEQIEMIVDAFAGKLIKSASGISNKSEIAAYLQTTTTPPEEVKKVLSRSFAEAISQTRNCLMIYASVGDNFEGSEPNYKEDKYKKPEDQKSWDGRISCKLSGPETIDFDGCMNVLNAYNGAKVVFEGTNAIQQFQAQDFMYDQQMKLMQQDPTDIDSSTAALESQKDGLEKQGNMAETRRALLIGKIALLEGLASKLPNSEETIQKCQSANFGGARIDEIISRLPDRFSAVQITINKIPSQNHCNDAFFQVTGSHDILANQGLATSVHAIALEAGVDVVKESVAINAFEKQQDMLDGIINKVKGAEVVDLPEGFTTAEELTQYCQLYPTSAECTGLGGGTSTMVGAGNGISMNGNFGTNTSDVNIDNPSALDSATDNNDKLTKADIPTSTVSGGIDKGGGFADPRAAAAKVENAGFSNPGSGGGGGASAPGLSGGGSQQQGAAPTGGNAPSSSKLAYSGGGRSLSFSGGRGNSKSAAKTEGNPFANMFGKKDSPGDVINFRDLASKGEIGGKKGNIFEQISRKYTDVEKKDRLLKYDFINKQ